MTSPEREWNDVLKRLEKLERQNRRMKQIGAVALLGIAAVALMGQVWTTRKVEAQASPQRTVEANEFILRDESGTVRAKLYMSQEGPQLALLDANGQVRVELEAGELSALTLHDPNGVERAALLILCSDSPEYCRPSLNLTAQKYEAYLWADEDGADLRVGEVTGRRPAVYLAGVDANGPHVSLKDNKGFETALDANHYILRDEGGAVRGELFVDAFGPRLYLLDANGGHRVELEAEGLKILEPRQGISFWDIFPVSLLGSQPGVHLQLTCSGTPSVCSPTLSLMSSDRKYEVSLSADRDRSVLQLGEVLNTLERAREIYNLGEKAPPPKPTMTMFLSADENGSKLELLDRQGFSAIIGSTALVTPRTGATRKTSAASVVLFDKDKHVIWQAP
ncbi:MAG: hypothetical protein HY647_02710 [Acidobacteria bacterium]|nr:hypothetical protein [Acidobacteriota bacterium]